MTEDLKVYIEQIRRGFIARPNSLTLRPLADGFFNVADLKLCRFFPVDVEFDQ